MSVVTLLPPGDRCVAEVGSSNLSFCNTLGIYDTDYEAYMLYYVFCHTIYYRRTVGHPCDKVCNRIRPCSLDISSEVEVEGHLRVNKVMGSCVGPAWWAEFLHGH